MVSLPADCSSRIMLVISSLIDGSSFRRSMCDAPETRAVFTNSTGMCFKVSNGCSPAQGEARAFDHGDDGKRGSACSF